MGGPDRVRETAPGYPLSDVKFTYEDYCRMPDGKRYELVEGEIRVTPSPGVAHQRVSGRINEALRAWVETTGMGEVLYAPLDIVLDQYNVVQPDILCVMPGRAGIITRANIQGPPDLVVEILSPGNSEWDRKNKRHIYEKHGVRELWLVDPDSEQIELALHDGHNLETAKVYAKGTRLSSHVLEGFVLDVVGIFIGVSDVQSYPDRVREGMPVYPLPDVKFTYEDYCRMPDGRRYELVEGEMRVIPSPSTVHQRTVGRLMTALNEAVEERGLGEVFHAPLDVVLSRHNVLQPDILFVSSARSGIITEPNIQGAPDLVIEILSPIDSEWDTGAKRLAYEKYGVQEMWLVDTEERTVELVRSDGRRLVTVGTYVPGAKMASAAVEGFTLDVSRVFG